MIQSQVFRLFNCMWQNCREDTICNLSTSQDLDSDAVQISTYCSGDDDVYLTFKGIATSKDLAAVQCR